MDDGTCKPALMDLDWGAFFDFPEPTFPPFPPFPLPPGYEKFCKISKKIRNFVRTIFLDFDNKIAKWLFWKFFKLLVWSARLRLKKIRVLQQLNLLITDAKAHRFESNGAISDSGYFVVLSSVLEGRTAKSMWEEANLSGSEKWSITIKNLEIRCKPAKAGSFRWPLGKLSAAKGFEARYSCEIAWLKGSSIYL